MDQVKHTEKPPVSGRDLRRWNRLATVGRVGRTSSRSGPVPRSRQDCPVLLAGYLVVAGDAGDDCVYGPDDASDSPGQGEGTPMDSMMARRGLGKMSFILKLRLPVVQAFDAAEFAFCHGVTSICGLDADWAVRKRGPVCCTCRRDDRPGSQAFSRKDEQDQPQPKAQP